MSRYLIFHFSGSTPTSGPYFLQDYKSIARKLGGTDKLDGEELLMAVRERLELDTDWVLVLDNADNLGLFGVGRSKGTSQRAEGAPSLYNFIPRTTGTVLWTSHDEMIAGTLVIDTVVVHSIHRLIQLPQVRDPTRLH